MLTCLLIPSGLIAQAPVTLGHAKVAEIDSIVAALRKSAHLPSVSVAIAIHGKIVYSKASGLVDLEDSTRATPRSLYRLASVTKPMTGVAVMQLVEAGKIDLDRPIQTYVPDFPTKKYPVTTRELLGHISGIRHYNGAESSSTRHYASLTQALAIFENDSLVHAPGAAFTYSTYGYTLLGVLVERVAGMPFFDYLKAHILIPAGMSETFVDDPLEIIPRRARGYDADSAGRLQNAEYIDPSYKIPAGGLIATADDVVAFLIAVGNGTLLKPETLSLMSQSLQTSDGKRTSYGLGWELANGEWAGGLWHTGGQQGSSSTVLTFPSIQYSIAILTNVGDAIPPIVETMKQITNTLVPPQSRR